MFKQVELLIRLLSTCPASSCEAERSFSALRHLKTYLRSTMLQGRLNSLAVCHIHKHILNELDIIRLCSKFVSQNDYRHQIFGKYKIV